MDFARAFLNARRAFAQWPAMHTDPVALALRHVSETKHLLDALITSSESFDYPKAKLALKALEKKSRELAKAQAELQTGIRPSLAPNVIALPCVR
jgi:hypothetical protein